MVKAVLFDLDDTIYDHTNSLRTGLKAVLNKYDCFKSYSLDDFVNEHLRLLKEIHQSQVLTGKLSVKEARIERFKRAIENTGLKVDDKIATEASEFYRTKYESNRKLIPGTYELLHDLKKKVKIGIVSNNLVSQQRDKIEYFGLGKFIDSLIVSETTRVTKPNPKIFQIALNELNVKKNEAVMIGDSWEEDVIGAFKTGIKPLWFNRNKLPLPEKNILIEINSFLPTERMLKLIFN